MWSRILGHDPLLKINRIFHYDPETDRWFIETQQDVTDVIEAAKGRYNSYDERSPWKGELHKVASIPISVWFDLKKKGIADDEQALRRWLNDPDNRVFRTRPGNV